MYTTPTPTDDASAPILAALIRQARQTAAPGGRRLSQRALAKLAGVNSETIMRIEAGRNTRVGTLDKIRRVLPGLHTTPPTTTEGIDVTVSDLATRVGYLIHGLTSADRLHRVRALVLQLLIDEQREEHAAGDAPDIDQEGAERRLLDKNKRRATKQSINDSGPYMRRRRGPNTKH